MAAADMTASEGIANGVVPFVFGDVIKAAAAGLVLPGAWKLLGESGHR
jgi:biotin transport system substrate-specific component